MNGHAIKDDSLRMLTFFLTFENIIYHFFIYFQQYFHQTRRRGAVRFTQFFFSSKNPHMCLIDNTQKTFTSSTSEKRASFSVLLSPRRSLLLRDSRVYFFIFTENKEPRDLCNWRSTHTGFFSYGAVRVCDCEKNLSTAQFVATLPIAERRSNKCHRYLNLPLLLTFCNIDFFRLAATLSVRYKFALFPAKKR
jgi:hypothetical protein